MQGSRLPDLEDGGRHGPRRLWEAPGRALGDMGRPVPEDLAVSQIADMG